MMRVAMVAALLIAGCLGPAEGPADVGSGLEDGAGTDPGAGGGAGDGPGAGAGHGHQDLMDRIEAAIEQALREA